MLRRTVRQFIERELAPSQTRWADQGYPDPEAWTKAGSLGLLLTEVPQQYGGGGGTFAHEAVLIEELSRHSISIGFGIQSIVARYIISYGSEEQKLRWLPRMASGHLIGALAITEPASGSDMKAIQTTARKKTNHYLINGSKTFITNGLQANLVCVAVRTGSEAVGMKGLSLVMLETAELRGYQVGRPLLKVGRHSQDVCELFFEDVQVPIANLLGDEGRGMFQIMEQLSYERLAVALSAVAAAEKAIEITTEYVKSRRAFNNTLFDLQNTRFKLAECKTEARIGRVFVNQCIDQLLAGRLDAITAAMAKYWLTDRQFHIIDECMQLHGGYGYMREFPIADLWMDSRVQRVYAGSNEIMKEIIGQSL